MFSLQTHFKSFKVFLVLQCKVTNLRANCSLMLNGVDYGNFYCLADLSHSSNKHIARK